MSVIEESQEANGGIYDRFRPVRFAQRVGMSNPTSFPKKGAFDDQIRASRGTHFSKLERFSRTFRRSFLSEEHGERDQLIRCQRVSPPREILILPPEEGAATLGVNISYRMEISPGSRTAAVRHSLSQSVSDLAEAGLLVFLSDTSPTDPVDRVLTYRVNSQQKLTIHDTAQYVAVCCSIYGKFSLQNRRGRHRPSIGGTAVFNQNGLIRSS